MSDPNQPYGAVPPPGFPPASGPPQGPPPGFPPPGFPPPGGPAGPPPGGPWGPPSTSGGSKGRGLWIALGVIGALLLVGVVIGLVLLIANSDGDDEKGEDDPSAAAGAGPEDVVEGLLDAAEDSDCDKAKTFLTESAQAADPCSAAEFRLLSSGEVDSDVGDAVVDGEEASVPVHFDNEGTVEDYLFNLEQVDGEWLVASYAVDHDSSDDPSDGATTSTDLPTDSTDSTDSTDGGTSPGGTSTADSVANDPVAVTEAFMAAFVNGDCATAEDLVTETYLADEGKCDPTEITPFAAGLEYEVGEADVDEAAGTATVPVDITVAGEKERGTFALVKEDGEWRINGSSD
ncbi:MAG TPA: hypothetical protein VNS46_03260 [Nocardioides sp.]|nr:hypothetical protein [Nocardioides sp.]